MAKKSHNSGEKIREFIVAHVTDHPADIARVAAEKYGLTRQAIHKHLQKLVADGVLKVSGKTRQKRYQLAPLEVWTKRFKLASGLSEDEVWRNDVAPSLKQLPENVRGIWHYSFTEMFNNAIDHSGAKTAIVQFEMTAATTTLGIQDDGVGIFKKIQTSLRLADERHAVLELAKGKFTTDPAKHSGQGIFFTSKMFDSFQIISGVVHFSHSFEERVLEGDAPKSGTLVTMVLSNNTSRTTKSIFDKFTLDEDYDFDKTVVPVNLMQYGDDNLVSRSQAKRLLVRFEEFKLVVLDFSGVKSIGQAFADEVFRVFQRQHPGVEIQTLHVASDVKRMISRAKSAGE